MSAAEASDVFACSPQNFYSIITDFSKYPEFLSEVKSCQVVETSGQRQLVEYSVSVIKSFKYRLWFEQKPPGQLVWSFASGDIFKTCNGSWTLEEVPQGVRATYKVDATFGVFVPGMVTKTLLSANLPNMIAAYHKRVAQLFPR